MIPLTTSPDLSTYLEAVHRLTDLGAVVTHVGTGTSQEGFDAAWRMISLIVVEDNLISRCEMFDEADLDAALARFDQLSRQAPLLENAATRVYERLQAYFAAREWDAMAEILADDHCSDDRRRVVNAGIRRGRDVQIANMQTAVGLGTTNITSTVIATRGERLALRRVRFSGRDQRPEAFHTETLGIVEIDADERMAALVTFDLDDMEAAFEELDARYLAGEAAAHSQTWSVIARECAAFNRHELTAVDYITVDHRPLPIVEAYTQAALRVWDVTPDFGIHIEAVHRLSGFGAVATYQANGTSPEGFDGEWRMILLLTAEGDRINRCEVFDETDLDAALARFEELQPQARRLENAAGRIVERYQACFSTHDWTALAELLADDMVLDDRRRVVNAGVRRGRDVYIADNRAAVEVGAETISMSVIATRGERLALAHARAFNRGAPPGEVGAEWLGVAEIDADERIVAIVVFDLDDIDAAYEELDARYLAGEAAAHSRMWSVIRDGYSTLNRHELPPTAPDFVNIDHRRGGSAFAPGDLLAFVRASWDDSPDNKIYVEAVHRLTNLGAVVTSATHGASLTGFDAEWREIGVVTVDDDMINRAELFDEADLDAALARFDELHPLVRRLENAATQVAERLQANFAARDWTARAELLADDCSTDDRRRVVNAGNQHGRDADIANMRAIAALGVVNIALTTIATRGERLALSRARMSGRDQRPEAFYTETLTILEIDTNNQAAAQVTFDPDDIDAALAELDARYLAGEAAAHAHTWSVIAGANAGFNRRELPTFTPDSVLIDHRPLQTLGAVDLVTAARSFWDVAPDVSVYIEAVHRLSELGTVVTQVLKGTSQEGFDAEWRTIGIFTVEGGLLSHCEVYDEADLDAALARFEELQPQARRLENAASRADEHFFAYFGARNWAALADTLTDNSFIHDRRPVVNAGLWNGRDLVIANMRAVAEAAAIITSIIATRGERLALSRIRSSNRDPRQGEFGVEMLNIVEIDTDERIAAHVEYDVDDIDAAFAELDARYLAGEAAQHSHTWSVIAGTYTMFNRHVLPATDLVTIDHRRGTPFAPGDLTAAMRVSRDLTPDLSIYIEAVHRLSKFGAVITNTAYGTSKQGFDAEWRTIQLLTVEGDRINSLEIFDEADLDAALARFEELGRPARRLQNKASRAGDRFFAYFGTHNWAAIAEILADDSFVDDRRRVVNAGFWDGRDVVIANMRALEEGGANITSTVVATRGERLALIHICSANRDQRQGEFGVEMLGIAEIDTDERIAAHVLFDVDDIDAAFAELDARYLAGEAAAYAHTWSVNSRLCAGFNRHELPATTPDWIYIDHRPLVTIEANDLPASMRASWDLTPDISIYMEAVHRLSDLGAVVTAAVYGSSQEGFDAEWRMIDLFTVEGDLISRCEIFDEADLDAALARFEELQPQAPRLENAATQLIERFQAYFAARNWPAIAESSADQILTDDRRSVVGSGVLNGRDIDIANMRAAADLGSASLTSAVIATRGERLALARFRMSGRDQRPEAFYSDMLGILQLDADNRVTARILFDLDDIDTAFEELDNRYLAGEGADHAHAWSVIAQTSAAFNRHELPAADWVIIDHRRLAPIDTSDLPAAIRAIWDLTPDLSTRIEAVHRLSSFGAVVTYTAYGTSTEGFAAEWRMVDLLTVEGDRISRFEFFDEADVDAALARFDELSPPTPVLENAATRAWARVTDAFNRRDLDGVLAVSSADAGYEDRRKGLGDAVDGPGRRKAVLAVFEMAPSSWRMEAEPIAIRGARLSLTRGCYRDVDDADRPIAVEFLNVMELGDDGRVQDTASFDPDDINGAFAELTARWIASGEVAHPEVIMSVHRLTESMNRHDWEAFSALSAGATYVNHRQLSSPGVETIADHMSSIRMMASLVPDFWVEQAEVLTQSAMGVVNHVVLKGTSTDGVAIEIPLVALILLDGDRVTRYETFDVDQRDLALARFEELGATSQPQ